VKKEADIQRKAVDIQNELWRNLIKRNKNTIFGKEHRFNEINQYADFKNLIPTRHYEDFISYIDKIKNGETDILQRGKPLYLLMTSGTTAGTKFIPLSKSGIRHQINAAMKVLCFHSINIRNADFMSYQMIFIQGSPELSNEYKVPSGRLSGVVYHHIPTFFQKNKLPTYSTNIIPNWQEKIDKIVESTANKDISIIGGIPPWCIQYFEKLRAKTKKENLKSIFPNLSIYIHGGLDFRSYKDKIEGLLGNGVHCLQTFPASEGFFAIQDRLDSDDMLLLLNQGIFYEFIPSNKIEQTNETIVSLENIEVNETYELVVTTDSGLWRYRMGDLVQITSKFPFRLRVIGRTSQFISAFGEHVIGYEIEKTMEEVSRKLGLKFVDYHVSPNIESIQYEWRIEWEETPKTPIHEIETNLDQALMARNKYYLHLITGGIIQACKIITLPSKTFSTLREKTGKEGGQNKVIRLKNETNISFQIDEIATLL